MPLYKSNGITYDLPPEQVARFKMLNPEAILLEEKQIVEVEKTNPSQETKSAAVKENVALKPAITDSMLEDISLELPKNSIRKKVRQQDLERIKLKKDEDRTINDNTDYLSELLKAGDLSLGEAIFSIPGFLYGVTKDYTPIGIAAQKINELMDLPPMWSTKEFNEKINAQPIIESLIEEREDRLKKVQNFQQQRDLQNDILENLDGTAEGYKKAALVTAGQLAQSLPTTAAIMAGGVAGLGRLGMMAGTTTLLGGPEARQQAIENPEQSEAINTLKGLGMAAAEGFFESLMGAGAIGNVYKDIIFREGPEVGQRVFKNWLVESYETALKKLGIPVAMVGEGTEEVATQITQNLINNKDPFEGVSNAFILGVAGGGAYGAPINIVKIRNGIKDAMVLSKINKDLKPTEYTNISYAFDPINIADQAQVNIAQIKGADKILNDKVNREVLGGRITKAKGEEIKLNFRATQQATSQIKNIAFNNAQKVEAVELLKRGNALTNQIKEQDNEGLNRPLIGELKNINERLNTLALDAQTGTITKAIKGKNIIRAKNSEELKNKYNITNKQALTAGAFVNPADNKIYINEEVAVETGDIDVAQHELLHVILQDQFKSAKDKGKNLIEEFKNIVGKENSKIVDDIIKNEPAYDENYMRNNPDEFLTQFSNAVLEDRVNYNETIFTKIKDFLQKIFGSKGFKSKFKTGKDVYNFMRNYSQNIKQGELSTKVLKLVPEEIQVDDVVMSKKASEKVQKLYEEKGPDEAAFEIIQEFKPITLDLTRKRRNAPNYNEEELVSEIETGKGGIFDLIRSYKKDSGVPLAAYINSLLPKRTIAASKRILGEEFTADIADVQIAETQATEPEVIETAVQEELPKIKIAERIFTPEEQTKLKEKVSQELPNITEEQLTFKTLPNLTAEVIAEKLNMPAKKLTGAANFTQDEFGRVQQFIKDNIKTVKLALPQAAILEGEAVSEELIGTATNVPNKLLKNPKLYTRLERTTKKAGLVPYQKNKNIQDVDILEAIGIIEDKLTKGPRDPEAQTAKGMLNILGRTAANQEVREQGAQTETLSKSQQLDTRAGIGDNILFSAKGKKVSNKIVDKAFRDPKEVKKAREALIDTLKLLGIENAIQYIIPTARRSTAKKVTYKVIEEIGNELRVKELDGQNSTRYFLVENQSDFVNNLLKKAFPNDNIKLTKGNQAISVNGKEIITPKFTNIGQSPKGFTDGTFENNIQERVNFALEQRAGMKKIVEALMSLYNNNVIDENQLFMILQTFNSSVEALIRTAAIPKFYFKGTGKTDEDYRYEHTQTASDTLVEIFRLIVKPNTGYTFDQIMEGFDVAIIPKVYDNIINTEHRSEGPKLDGTKTGKLILGKGKNIKRYLTPNVKRKIKEANLPPLNLKEFKYSVPQENKNILFSKKKAASKNNSKLPKSKQAKKGSTNQLVLDNMKLIDEEINQRRKEFFDTEKLSQDFNKIIENKTGIAKEKKYSDARAQTVGANKGRFKFFIPPSAEDFVGLLYNTLGKGKLGEQQMAWYKENLLDPYARAMNEISSARVALYEDYKTLKKDLKIIPKNLRKKIPGDDFTVEQAVRAYIWNKQGMKVPGLDNADVRELISYVANNNELVVFADNLIDINKGDGYPEPDAGWEAGTITTDLINGINTTRRAEALQQWQENVDIIFSKDNLNKLQAVYGTGYRKALENILTRMKTGRNRGFNNDSLTGRFTDWINNSVGAIMFFNMRSALLQTISSVNFINYSDNNIFKAAKAFGNQKQYWSDFKFLFNSDFLKERRGGLRFNVSESDIADMAKEGGARGVLSKILQAGFLPTQAADSFAIASGGATFYRNRINALVKEEYNNRINKYLADARSTNQRVSAKEIKRKVDSELKEIEKKAQEQAFLDFREVAEEAQQSSRPDRISAQQAGSLGRIILAFANTPAQYARLTKKALSDAVNNRGSRIENISKAIYYVAVQNFIFTALQNALFALAFDDEEEEDKKKEQKYLRMANNMSDSFLRGLGFAGAAVSTGKNVILKLIDESDKAEYKQNYGKALGLEVLGISPPVQSKVKKLVRAGDQYKYAKKAFDKDGFKFNSELYLPPANVISALTNIPLDRVVRKTDNLVNMTQADLAAWERAALFFGWQDWELNIDKKSKNKNTGSFVIEDDNVTLDDNFVIEE